MLATGLKYVLNKSGLRTEPWDTPKFKAAGDEVDSEIFTDWDLSARYYDSNSRAMPSTPHDLRHFTNNKWSTVSNAEDKSKRTRKRTCLLSTARRMLSETQVDRHRFDEVTNRIT